MPKITVLSRDGAAHAIDAADGASLMQSIRDAGLDELLALCGGFCSCATCHVHIDPDWFAVVGPAGVDEAALLESSENWVPTSRLSCQIRLTESLSGLKTKIAPPD